MKFSRSLRKGMGPSSPAQVPGPIPTQPHARLARGSPELFCVHEIGGMLVSFPRAECPDHEDLAADDYTRLEGFPCGIAVLFAGLTIITATSLLLWWHPWLSR